MELGKGGGTFLKKSFPLPSPSPIPPSPKTFDFIESLSPELPWTTKQPDGFHLGQSRETSAKVKPSRNPARRPPRLQKSLKRKGGGLEGERRNFLKKVSPSPLQFHSITNAFAACVAAGMFPSAKRRTTSSAAGSCLRKASCASGLSRPRTQFTVSSPPCGERPMPRRRR